MLVLTPSNVTLPVQVEFILVEGMEKHLRWVDQTKSLVKFPIVGGGAMTIATEYGARV